jgi:hypothetical protein
MRDLIYLTVTVIANFTAMISARCRKALICNAFAGRLLWSEYLDSMTVICDDTVISK